MKCSSVLSSKFIGILNGTLSSVLYTSLVPCVRFCCEGTPSACCPLTTISPTSSSLTTSSPTGCSPPCHLIPADPDHALFHQLSPDHALYHQLSPVYALYHQLPIVHNLCQQLHLHCVYLYTWKSKKEDSIALMIICIILVTNLRWKYLDLVFLDCLSGG